MLSQKNRLKLAIPNKGRLREPVLELLRSAGYQFRLKERLLYASCLDEDLTLVFLRAEDIPLLVEEGVIEFGITGQDLILEKEASVEEILPLGLGRCRLSLAVNEGFNYEGPQTLAGKRIATSFPSITQKWFAGQNVNISCLRMSGSLEVMVGLGLAEAIVDLVETGDTLKENNLAEVSEIGRFETVFIGNQMSASLKQASLIKRRLEGIIIARRYSMLEYNIKKELLKKAEAITPGFEAPTIAELDEEGWCAVKVMVEKNAVIQVMDQLESLGATAIIETELKNCRL